LDENLFQNLKDLAILWIGENDITNLEEKTFNGLLKLRSLYIGKNNIEFLPHDIFVDLKNLQRLVLEYNPIKMLRYASIFQNLKNLKHLILVGTLTPSLPENILDNNLNLIEFQLREGKILRMSNKIFSHLDELKALKFEDNFCTSVDFDSKNHSKVFLEDMLLPCSCLLARIEDTDIFQLNFWIGFGVFGFLAIMLIFVFKKGNLKEYVSANAFFRTIKDCKLT
jgi:hypothetical protein